VSVSVPHFYTASYTVVDANLPIIHVESFFLQICGCFGCFFAEDFVNLTCCVVFADLWVDDKSLFAEDFADWIDVFADISDQDTEFGDTL
jgi:hypothetical protein